MKKTVIALAAAGLVAFGINAQAMTGEEVYKKACTNCHNAAVAPAMKAPASGSNEDWAPRIAKGMDALMQSVMNGMPGTAMPARGACADCTDDDLKAALQYMVDQASK